MKNVRSPPPGLAIHGHRSRRRRRRRHDGRCSVWTTCNRRNVRQQRRATAATASDVTDATAASGSGCCGGRRRRCRAGTGCLRCGRRGAAIQTSAAEPPAVCKLWDVDGGLHAKRRAKARGQAPALLPAAPVACSPAVTLVRGGGRHSKGSRPPVAEGPSDTEPTAPEFDGQSMTGKKHPENIGARKKRGPPLAAPR